MFVDLHIHDPFAIVFFAIVASAMLSLLELVGGILAVKFEHIAAMTNFVIVPLSFLSGTFYSIDRLPEASEGATFEYALVLKTNIRKRGTLSDVVVFSVLPPPAAPSDLRIEAQETGLVLHWT